MSKITQKKKKLKKAPITYGCGNRVGCKNPGEPPHTCPYQEEINDDFETVCTCCPECTQECLWDI